MSTYGPAIEVVLMHEGGLSDRPTDPGGITNFGVSLRFLKTVTDIGPDGYLLGDLDHDGDVDGDDIRQMTAEDARRIYRSQWWERYRYGLIRDQAIATKVLDLSINMGPGNAHVCLQRAMRAVECATKIDGLLGPNTRRLANSAPPFALLAAFRESAAGYYRQINYEGADEYLSGWLNRAYS